VYCPNYTKLKLVFMRIKGNWNHKFKNKLNGIIGFMPLNSIKVIQICLYFRLQKLDVIYIYAFKF